MLKEKLKNTCSFAAALEDKDDTGYPRAELFYVRAYHDGSHWWNTVFHIHKGLMVPALVKEVDPRAQYARAATRRRQHRGIYRG